VGSVNIILKKLGS